MLLGEVRSRQNEDQQQAKYQCEREVAELWTDLVKPNLLAGHVGALVFDITPTSKLFLDAKVRLDQP